ncbi:hypothetical protein T492DRAFT_833076 [Pavlovales sp. CCMP2436]|nr:hypothetical protein T492DRAFT_833076 [Pavlovales sp. CCMP2436]
MADTALGDRMTPSSADQDEALSDRLVELLNDAMLVDTEKEKLDMVHEMEEILLNRGTGLLAEFLPHALAMHTDKIAAVRRAVLGLAEHAARKHSEHLPRVLELLAYRVADEAPTVAKRVLSAYAALLKLSLLQLASPRAPAKLQPSLIAVADRALSYLLASGNDGLRAQAASVAEQLAVLLTPRPANSTQQIGQWDLGRVPAGGTTSIEVLSALGARAVDALASALPATLGAGTSDALAIAILAALAAVARECPVHAPKIGSALAA